ncbi:hypothetical protein SAMN05192534_11952 [Alteribacillus persepolensis]|uniref:Sporulation lipoprotein YhcN/YlaJ (Spore_YhcN_YlaJ) n=1 Tax=Alteribacillus persepolensis TaxID=568899 RepID=A0A1G8HDT1_9BACI|nr:hypothetical protein [Alteribacillus persepolensis]SDI04640.1 hypothetical protein SAMN05192534_11952 [Alteribacillus persepolensis]
MKKWTCAVFILLLFSTAACQQAEDNEQAGEPRAPWLESLNGPGPANSERLRPAQDGSSPSDYNQGPGNVSMTTRKQTQGSDKEMAESFAQDLGFSPLYTTFGGRYAYVYVNADDSWNKNEKDQKKSELEQKYQQAFPRYDVRVYVVNGGE